MSLSLLAFIVLIVAFLWGSLTALNAGLIAAAAAFIVGTLVAGLPLDDVLAQFPAGLFFILAGATLLFVIVRLTGTIDLLAHWAELAARERRPLIPVLMFLLTAVLATAGAFTPAAVAIVAPVALSLGARYGINHLAMGLVIVQGANAGAFSPVNPFGVVSNSILREAGDDNPLQLYINCFLFNAVLAAIAFVILQFLLGRRMATQDNAQNDNEPGQSDGPGKSAAAATPVGTGELAGSAIDPSDPTNAPPADASKASSEVASATAPVATAKPGRHAHVPPATLTPMRALTLAGLVALLVLTLGFSIDVGVASIIISVLLLAVRPSLQKPAIEHMPWSAILLVTGIVTYVGVLDEIGAIDDLERTIAGLGGGASLATLVTSYVVAAVSAFASTTGTLGAITPLVVPLAADPTVSGIGVVSAISISSSVVDISPMSTTGALLMANAEGPEERTFFRALLIWAILMIAVVPTIAWLIFVAI